MMRIGVVAFANTLPLAWGLETLLPGAELVRTTPAQVAEGLSEGRLDVGLVPVAALAMNPGWAVVPGLGIASRGPVRSVLLLSRVPLGEIHEFLPDPGSRTSNVLARLWLTRRMGCDLRLGTPPAGEEGVNEDPRTRLKRAEATVVIGDEALAWNEETRERVDLGEAWTDWTGLPFVFAVWAGPGGGDPSLARALEECHHRNMRRMEELVHVAAPHDPSGQKRIRSYFCESIRYRLGEDEERGLRRFFELAAEEKLLPAGGAGVSHVHSN